MASGAPRNANEFIEQQLNERLTTLEQDFDSDMLCVVSPIMGTLDDTIRASVEDMRQRQPQRPRLSVLLTTEGGFIETVQRIVETLRHHYQHVSFIIPNYAYSAGTVLAMSGDDIYMDYYSRLGPIDPQVQTSNGRFVPALGYLKQWERLLKKGKDGTLTQTEFDLMVTTFDHAELYKYEQARELSVALLKEWLAAYKFKNWVRTETRGITVTTAMRKARASKIARQLNNTERWHSHGHGISMAVLRDELNLMIDDLATVPDRHERVKEYDGLLSDYIRKLGFGGALHSAGQVTPILR